MAELETERLRIREVLASDVDVFLRYMQEERYWRDVPVEPPTTAWVAALLDRSLASRAKNPRTDYFMAVTDKLSGELIGEAILTSAAADGGRARSGGASAQADQGRDSQPRLAVQCCASASMTSDCIASSRSAVSKILLHVG
jgi:hypothetical protein